MGKRIPASGNQFMSDLFAPEVDWRPTPVSQLPSWREAKRVAFDVETYDPHLKDLGIGALRGGYVTGYAFAIEGGPKHYLPVKHLGGDNLPDEEVRRYLRDNLRNFDGEIAGARLDYDLGYLLAEGFEFKNVRKFRDVQIADPLLYELHISYSLENIGQRHGVAAKYEDKLKEAANIFNLDPKKGMWKLPARYVGEYAESDVTSPLELLRIMEPKLEENELQDVWDIECDILPVLVHMRHRGVRIDEEKLALVESWATRQEDQAAREVKRLSGSPFELGESNNTELCARALSAAGVSLSKTRTGQWNVDAAVFRNSDSRVAKLIGHCRKMATIRSTFCNAVRRHMINGRIHCTFNQIARETEDGDQKGVRYGRLSCTNPNLQQQPSRDPWSELWRSIYIPEEGHIWAAPDYSQQEPRWTTHFASVMDLPKAREAARAYRENPDLDNHTFMAELTGLPRKAAKIVYLGLCYGEGGAKLCRDLGLDTRWALSYRDVSTRDRVIEYFETQAELLKYRMDNSDRMSDSGRSWEAAGEEGQRIIDTFNQRAPFIRELAKAASNVGDIRGFVKSISGRRLHFPRRDNGSYDWTHKALNRVIQGSGADQMKKAMVAMFNAGFFLQLQIHDEVAISVLTVEEAQEAANIMRDIIPDTHVPFKVDAEVGTSWGELVSIEEWNSGKRKTATVNNIKWENYPVIIEEA